MQSTYPPPAPPASRPRLPRLLLLGAVVLMAIAGVAGYLIGSAGLQSATLRVNMENRFIPDLTVQIAINGHVRQTVWLPVGQTVTVDLGVTYATADGAYFEVRATSTQGPSDSDRILVNSPGIYVVNLWLG
mgnify:CR=1 FL=1